jgi:hypothetical protein
MVVNQPQAAVRIALRAGFGGVSASGLIRRVVPFANSKLEMSIASPSAWADSLPVVARFRLRHSNPGPVRTLVNSVFRLPVSTGDTKSPSHRPKLSAKRQARMG